MGKRGKRERPPHPPPRTGAFPFFHGHYKISQQTQGYQHTMGKHKNKIRLRLTKNQNNVMKILRDFVVPLFFSPSKYIFFDNSIVITIEKGEICALDISIGNTNRY